MRQVASVIKRCIDIGIAVGCLPLLAIAIGIAGMLIKLETPGPILFKQERVGLQYRHFYIYKLRTMVQNAEKIGAGLYTEKDDPRFTKVGLWLRRYSIDELPQLINILKGDMSIVGPRPMLPMTIQEYADDYKTILQMRPGLTGLAQVSGRHTLNRRTRLELDKKYVCNYSIFLDFQIIARTFWVVIAGEGHMDYQSRKNLES